MRRAADHQFLKHAFSKERRRRRAVHCFIGTEKQMNKILVLSGMALLIGALAAGTASAQEVIKNPGRCAQFYPNANCQNYGPGNPYRAPQSYQQGWRSGYAWYRHGRHWRHRYHRYE